MCPFWAAGSEAQSSWNSGKWHRESENEAFSTSRAEGETRWRQVPPTRRGPSGTRGWRRGPGGHPGWGSGVWMLKISVFRLGPQLPERERRHFARLAFFGGPEARTGSEDAASLSSCGVWRPARNQNPGVQLGPSLALLVQRTRASSLSLEGAPTSHTWLPYVPGPDLATWPQSPAGEVRGCSTWLAP